MQNVSSIELLAAAYPEFLAIAGAFGHKPVGQGQAGIAPRIQVARNVSLTCTGVGKVNAAIAAANILDAWEAKVNGSGEFQTPLLVNIGIAGTLPRLNGPSLGEAAANSGVELLDVILASRSCYGDEGIQTPERFLDCWEMGFALGPFAAEGVVGDLSVAALLPQLRTADWAARSGPVATVSTCSGTDSLAKAVALRTGAIAEAMEGAAVGHAVALKAVARSNSNGVAARFAELRVISNTTGDRARQVWKIKPALERLGQAAVVLVERLGTLP